MRCLVNGSLIICVPIANDIAEYKALVSRHHQDLQSTRSVQSYQREKALTVGRVYVGAMLINFVNTDMVTKLTHFKLPDDFVKAMGALPSDKRLEVIYARHPDDRRIRAVKQNLPKKDKRMMTEEQFHDFMVTWPWVQARSAFCACSSGDVCGSSIVWWISTLRREWGTCSTWILSRCLTGHTVVILQYKILHVYEGLWFENDQTLSTHIQERFYRTV